MVKLFLSYRHESDAKHSNHQARVRQLGEALQKARIDVVLDQFYMDVKPAGPDEQWPAWCERQVPAADKVLMVASEGYFRCYDGDQPPGTGLGAACETTAIRNLLYGCSYKSEKFRIAYFEKAHLDNIPVTINGMHRFNALNPDDLESLIKWAGGMPSAAMIPIAPAWPQAIHAHEPDLANRSDEFAFFGSATFVMGESLG